MSLNWKEIDLVLSELDLEGAQIQKIVQTAYDVLALHVYKEGTARAILIALTPGACRIHETFRAVPRSDKPLRFAEFLKSRIKDARIDGAVQLGTDRIVRLSVRHGEERFRIYIRLWSNAANVVVTDESGIVLDAMRRNPKRGEVTGGAYSPEAEMAARAAADEAAAVEGAAAAGGTAGEVRPVKEFAVRELPGGGSFNERVDAWYAEHAGALSLEALREQAKKAYETRITRLSASLESLEEKRVEYAAAQKWKEYGDIVMANIGVVAPGTEWLETINFYTDEKVRIRLEKKKTLPAVAEGYYEQYRKAKNGLADVEAEIAAGRATLQKLEADLARLLAEGNPLRLLKALRSLKSVSKPEDKKRPGLSFRKDGWLLVVGRTGAENDELLRRHVRGSDLWLHARDYPGAYVFVKARAGKSVPLDILLDAGNLALFYSKGRNSGEGDLYYTQAKYLRRAKNGPVGLVLPTQEKNLRVKVDEARLAALENCREE
jgi:predicted ribosome quality control (RQC) complex YloA/Tae2 family protein